MNTARRCASDPPVAIVIACCDQGAYLPEALASVAAQRYPNLRCIVVDDGSRDPHTLDVLQTITREHDVQLVRHPQRRGLPAARNTGVRAAGCEFFVPLDADDRLHPDFVARLLDALRSDPHAAYAYAHVRLFGAREGLWACPPFDPRRLLLENLSPATALIRRDAFDAVGGYRESMTEGYEDWDLWVALASAGWRGVCVPQPLFEYRQHPRGLSMRDRAEQQHRTLLRAMVARHADFYRHTLRIAAADPDVLTDEVLAARELERIARSRFWRLLHPLADPLRGRDFGPSPRRTLARVRAGAAYRLIQRIKRTPLHRWYARRRYGPPADAAADASTSS